MVVMLILQAGESGKPLTVNKIRSELTDGGRYKPPMYPSETTDDKLAGLVVPGSPYWQFTNEDDLNLVICSGQSFN